MTSTSVRAGGAKAGSAKQSGAGPRSGARQRRLGRGGRSLGEALAQWGFVLPAVIYLAAFFGYPVVQNVVMSLQEYTTRTFYTGDAPFVGFANYAKMFSSSLFSAATVNTLVFTAASLAGQFSIGMGLALFFHRRFPLGQVLRSLLLLPWLLPLVVSATVWRWIMDQDSGVLNRTIEALGIVSDPVPWLSSPSVALLSVIVVNIWIGIPFTTVLLYSGLQSIPGDLYEAAALDGAGRVRTFTAITWPLLRPVVTVIFLLGVIYTIKVLDIILVLTGGGPANSTQTIATQAYITSFQQFEFGVGAAWSNVLVLISLVFSVIYLRANRRAVDA